MAIAVVFMAGGFGVDAGGLFLFMLLGVGVLAFALSVLFARGYRARAAEVGEGFADSDRAGDVEVAGACWVPACAGMTSQPGMTLRAQVALKPGMSVRPGIIWRRAFAGMSCAAWSGCGGVREDGVPAVEVVGVRGGRGPPGLWGWCFHRGIFLSMRPGFRLASW